MSAAILARTPRDLTAAWAQRIVKQINVETEVSHVEVVSVDIGTTTRVRVAVEHDGPGTVPKRWFVKMPSLEWRAKIITALPRLLHTEVRFYNEVAEFVPLNTPMCLAAHSRVGRGSTLVLADVAESDGVASRAGDCLSAAQARVVIEALAKFHASFWGKVHDGSDYRWLAGPVRRLEDHLGTALAVPLMKRGLGLAGTKVASALHTPAVRYARQRRKAMRFLAEGPQTLIHHDCHPGNLFWSKNQDQAGFLDWQLVRIGEGISDVAYFLATALAPETRRGHEENLISHYAQTLKAQGIDGIDKNQLRQRYRAHTAYAFEAMVVTLAVGGLMNLECNLELIRRAAAAVDDLDAFGALPV